MTDQSFVTLAELTADGLQEYAINGIHNVNVTRHLVVKDGDTKATYQTFKWPNLCNNTQIITTTDITSEGVPEVALLRLHTRLVKGHLYVNDGADSNIKVDVYNWNKLWSNTQLMEMDDVDGTEDWGELGKRKDDGRYQWVVKKGHDKRGVIGVFSWPADLKNVTPMLVSDRTGDGVRDVAITGLHSTNGKIHLVIKDGQALTEYGRHTVAGDWVDLLMNSYDVNNDGRADVLLSGVDASTGLRHFEVLDGTNLEILFER